MGESKLIVSILLLLYTEDSTDYDPVVILDRCPSYKFFPVIYPRHSVLLHTLQVRDRVLLRRGRGSLLVTSRYTNHNTTHRRLRRAGDRSGDTRWSGHW